MTSAALAVGGALAALAVLGLLLAREVRRVASPTVSRPAAVVLRGRRVSWGVELLLWVAAALLLVPRIVELLL